MNLLAKTRRVFTPKRGIWEGVLFGAFLYVLNAWWLQALLYDYLQEPALYPRLNLFSAGHFIFFVVIAGWPDHPYSLNWAWPYELLTLALLAGVYGGIWALLKSRFFWIGFALLLLTLLSLVIPGTIPIP